MTIIRRIETRNKVCNIYENEGKYDVAVNGHIRKTLNTLEEATRYADRIARRG